MHSLASRRIVPKPWGRRNVGALGSYVLPPALPTDEPIGEIWFEPEQSDVLVKYLFTSQRLSIQVHPNDVQARRMNAERGKEECWLILEAEPGAHYGIGLKSEVSPLQLAAAARDGSILDLIDWRPAHVGDFIFNPAGTVHAIGPGLTVLEVQQNSDVTLRLFDYNSDRQLHVDAAVAISRSGPHRHPLDTHIDFESSRVLVHGPHFGLAFCRGHVPVVPPNATNLQVVTWRHGIELAGDFVPPGSMIRINDVAELDTIDGCDFFLVWAVAHPD